MHHPPLKRPSFFQFGKERKGGGKSSGFVTFPMCSHQVPIKQLLPTLLGKRGANDVSPYEQLQCSLPQVLAEE
jgi:hypothetical protein